MVTAQEPSHSLAAVEEMSFRRLVDSITDYAIYMLDSQGIISTWNQGAQRFKGYTAAEILGQHFSRFYTEEDKLAGEPARALHAAAHEGKYEKEGWRVRKGGERFWAHVVIDPIRDEDGKLIGFAKITRDVTERRNTQQALLESEKRFSLLVQGVTDYAIYMLDPQGHVTNWNGGANRIKGYAAEEIIGQHFSRFYTPEDRSAGLPFQALKIAEREGKYEKEGWRIRKDGTRFWAHVIIDAIRDENGKLIGFAKVTRDITERKEAQEALEQAREALVQAQKMEAVGQLTGGIAHDFNNLLQALGGCLTMIARRTDQPDIQPLLQAGRQAVDRGAKLVQQLMTFARGESLRPETLALPDRILGMAGLLERVLRADIRLNTRFTPDLWPVDLDPTQFELAIINLAVNARDAMPNGGSLLIKAENVTLPPGNPRGLEGDFVHLSVADTGTGMPAEVKARAFDPFFTTKEVGKGSGLGLAQVYGLAHQGGGTAWIDSEEGRGTTINLLLKRSHSLPRQAVDRSRALPKAQRGGHILLVEDDPVVASTVAAALEDAGLMVTRVVTADEALPLLAGADAIDLLFSDVIMPGRISGIDLAQEARRLRPGLPVILTTGYSGNVADAEGIRILPKPYRIDELVDVLAREMSGAMPLAPVAESQP